MPTVPLYTRDVAPTPALRQGIDVQASPEDFGAAVGRGLEGLGNGLGQAADNAKTLQVLDDTSAAHDAETKFSDWLRDATYGDGGFMTLEGGAAVQASPKFQRDITAKQKELSSGLSQGARDIYTAATNGRISNALDGVVRYTSAQRKAWVIDSSTARASSFAQDAADAWANPVQVQTSLLQGQKEIARQGALMGWDDATLKDKLATYTSATMSGVLLRQSMDDPIAAATWAFRNADKLTTQDLWQVIGQIEPGLKQAAAGQASLSSDGSVQFGDGMKPLLDVMPQEARTELRAGVTQELLRQHTADAEQAKLAMAQHKDEVTLGIVTGKIASEDTILNDPMLDLGDKASLVEKFRSEQNSTASARDFVSRLGTGTQRVLNPFDASDRALADKSLDMVLQSVPADKAAAATVAFVKQAGVIPSSLIAGLRQGLASTDGQRVTAAVQLAAQLNDAAPQALTAADDAKDIRAAVATYRQLVDVEGKSADQVAQRLIDMRDPDKIAKADRLAPLWDQAVKANTFSVNDVLGAFGDNWLPGGPVAGLTPDQQQAVTADYLAAAKDAFDGPANGDAGIAKQIALQDMKRTYGLSRVSGQDVVTKFPPENFYPAIGGSQDYIRALALKDARTLDPKASNVMLVATPETAQDVRAGQPPRYNLMYQGANGVWDMAPSLFIIDKNDITMLSRLSSEEHSILFEGQRARDLRDQAKGLPPLGVVTLPAYILDMITRQPIPDDDVRQAALRDVQDRRASFLGTAPTRNGLVPQATPAFADRLAAYQQQHGFGIYAPQEAPAP